MFPGDAGHMPDTQSEPLLRLLLSGASASALRRLLDTHGDAANAISAGRRDWASHGISPAACRGIEQPEPLALAHALRWLSVPGRHVLGWRDALYPALLRRIASPPVMLFVAGDPGLMWRPAVAVVGSRTATAGGCANASLFAEALAKAGLCIVSGMAAGVDTAAHEAALRTDGGTVAVLGTGPDIAYPRANAALLERVAASGAVVSEHPPGTQPLRTHFPSRNRILAGLSLGTLVVEAAQRSGALITARQAAEAGREVFAIPGSIHNPMARGCHQLLRDGATLAESPADVLQALEPSVGAFASALRGELAACDALPAPTGNPLGVPSVLEAPSYHLLWQSLGHDPTCMDELVSRSGLTAAEVSSMLLTLELEGRVAAEHGRYSRIQG